MELTLDQALQKGIEAHKAGQVQEAYRYYNTILKANPKHPDANHNMGVLAVGVGKVQEALTFFKAALEANPSIAQYWLGYIDALVKLDRIDDAKAVFGQAKTNGLQGEGFDKIKLKLGSSDSENFNDHEPPKERLNGLINLHTKGQYKAALNRASQLLEQFPNSINLYNIIGAANQKLGKLEEAIDAYTGALSIKPDFAAAYNNIGIAHRNLGKLDEAIEAYNKALFIKPDFAEAFNNMGVALKAQGKVEEALEAFNKALTIKPDYAEACNNMGNTLQYLGYLDDAIEAYNKALAFKPDYTEAHRNLSFIKEYKENDNQINQVQELYKQEYLSEDQKCNLSFALFKMYEDIGITDKSFAFLAKGNSLRKQLLNYSIDQDKNLFSKLITAQPYLCKNSLDIQTSSIETIPIFILGMPRSGTTLVEQIISSHSEVLGAGELQHVSQLGLNLSVDPKAINTEAISTFRKIYLSELSKLSNGKQFVTDKMPQNFRFIPLICAAFPDAKIVHVKRNVIATCWSNFKQYFASRSLGYCYDLKDIVEYYNLYIDLMKLWQSHYADRIYDLNYESLTTDQENQTRKLIRYLELNWQESCLSPHNNKRSVRTASQQQVRQKVYQGSSEAWRKYEPYLNGAFDSLSP